jgi:broad specificity phosphatase PhoE
VRHGQSTWNAEGRIQGSTDFAVLTDKGEAQAETTRQMASPTLPSRFDVAEETMKSYPNTKQTSTLHVLHDFDIQTPAL